MYSTFCYTLQYFRDAFRIPLAPLLAFFVKLDSGWKLLTNATKRSILAVAIVLDKSLCFFRKPSNANCFKIFFNMCSQIRERNDTNMKICQFWGKEFISLSQKYKEQERKFSFLAGHIVIFGKHLSEFYWILLMCFEILNALLARKASTKILNWSTLFLLSLYTSRAGKRRQELWELSIISESAV